MKRKCWALPLFCLSLFLVSCGDDDGDVIPSDCDNLTGWILPGHQWVYEHYSDFVFADSLTIDITGEVADGVFSFASTYDDGSLYPTFTSYLKPCGNDIYSSSASSMTNAFVAYKVDGNVGEEWTYTSTTVGGYTVTAENEITGKNISVTVPAGTFSCLKIHQVLTSSQPSSLPVSTDFYLNNTAGIVKVDGSTTEYELVRKNY